MKALPLESQKILVVTEIESKSLLGGFSHTLDKELTKKRQLAILKRLLTAKIGQLKRESSGQLVEQRLRKEAR